MQNERLAQLFAYIKEDPNDPFLYYAIATEYAREGQLDQALNYFTQTRDKFPAYVGTYYHLGRLYEKLDKKENAIDSYRAGIKVADDARDLHARRELAQALATLLGDQDDY